MKLRKILSLYEIFLIISLSFCFAYFLSDEFLGVGSAQEINDREIAIDRLGESASSLSDISSGVRDMVGDTVNFNNPQFWEYIDLQGLLTSTLNSNDFKVGCCEKMTNDAICQNLVEKQKNECVEGKFHSGQECEDITNCELGCCIDNERGSCNQKASREKCTEDRGEWKYESEGDELCQIAECTKGCCIIGESPKYTTSRGCDYLADSMDLDNNDYEFDESIQFEGDCIIGGRYSITKGACIIKSDSGNKCEVTAEKLCDTDSDNVEFVANVLCTNKNIKNDYGIDCEPTTDTTCIEDLDEVYFLDSCGNVANIYDYDKIFNENNLASVEYWDKIFSKEDSCNAGGTDGNANSKTCGNCDYLKGSRCDKWREGEDKAEWKPEKGENYCRDMNCYDVPYYNGELGGGLVKKRNGESWCIYDGIVGNFPYDTLGIDFGTNIANAIPGFGFEMPFYFGKDTIGSRHYRYRCIDGEVEDISCEDYRNEICIEGEVKNEETGETFGIAGCKVNRWRECLGYNQESTGGIIPFFSGEFGSLFSSLAGLFPMLSNLPSNALNKANVVLKCASNSDCIYKKVVVSESQDLTLSLCVPKYPPGFDLKEDDGYKAAEDICKIGSQEMTVLYIKDLGRREWECVSNCEVRKKEFAVKMNELCISLGDCGSYVNYEGVPVEGYEVSKTPYTPGLGSIYSVFAIPIPGYKIPDNSGEIEEFLGLSVGGEGSGGSSEDSDGNTGTSGESDFDISSDFAWKTFGATAGATGAVFGATAVVAGATVGGAVIANYGALSAVWMATKAKIVGGFAGGALGIAGMAALGSLGGAILFPGAHNAIMASMAFGAATGAVAVGVSYFFGGGSLAGCFYSPAFIAACIATVVIFVVLLRILGAGEKKEVKVTFTCKPSELPMISDCSKCEDDEKNLMKQCTKYRCQSLGQMCEFEEEKGVGKCFKVSNLDSSAPRITPWQEGFSSGYTFEPATGETEGFKIIYNGEGGNCVPSFKVFKIGIQTDESALCKVSMENLPFEEMPSTPEFGYGHELNHELLLKAPSVGAVFESVSGLGIELQTLLEQSRDIKLYVKCEDRGENHNEAPYIINFCVQELPDFTSPSISMLNPASGTKLKYDTTVQPVELYTDEPAECKWSLNPGTNYENMENSFTCLNDAAHQDMYGYRCSADLNVHLGENTFYFRCKDNQGNPNTQDWPSAEGYKLIVTDSALSIASISPSGDVVRGGSLQQKLNLEVVTEGGDENGKAKCDFKLNNQQYISFLETDYAITHTQEFNLGAGKYKFDIKCKDRVGNEATGSTEFNVILDTKVPKVLRLYENNGLKIITDEEAWCYYSSDEEKLCHFDFDDEGVNYMSADSTQYVHTTSWIKGETYFIKCRDRHDNWPGECSIKVRASDLT